MNKIRGGVFSAFKVKNDKRSYTGQNVVPVDEISKIMQNEEIFIAELEFLENINQTDYFEIIQRLSKDDNIIKISPAFSPINHNLGISNNFYENCKIILLNLCVLLKQIHVMKNTVKQARDCIAQRLL